MLALMISSEHPLNWSIQLEVVLLLYYDTQYLFMSHECSKLFFMFQTQTADQHTLIEKSEVLPQQDPFTITIEGVTYRSIFTSQEEALLSNYIVKEVSTKTFITIRVLCNMVYNFCMKYEFACPPAWDVNQSADKEWMQGFMKRHTLIDWKNIFNKHRMKLVEPCNEVGEKLNDGYIILGVVTNEENEDKRPTLCDKIALDHNYALNTIYQP